MTPLVQSTLCAIKEKQTDVKIWFKHYIQVCNDLWPCGASEDKWMTKKKKNQMAIAAETSETRLLW